MWSLGSFGEASGKRHDCRGYVVAIVLLTHPDGLRRHLRPVAERVNLPDSTETRLTA